MGMYLLSSENMSTKTFWGLKSNFQPQKMDGTIRNSELQQISELKGGRGKIICVRTTELCNWNETFTPYFFLLNLLLLFLILKPALHLKKKKKRKKAAVMGNAEKEGNEDRHFQLGLLRLNVSTKLITTK